MFSLWFYASIFTSKGFKKEVHQNQLTDSSEILNVNQFNDVVFIGVNECEDFKIGKVFRIEKNTKLRVQKKCILKIFAARKSYLKGKELNKIDWNNDNNIINSNVKINANSFETYDSVFKIDVYLEVAGFTDSKVILYKKTQIIKYAGSKPDSITNFKFIGDLSKLKKSIN